MSALPSSWTGSSWRSARTITMPAHAIVAVLATASGPSTTRTPEPRSTPETVRLPRTRVTPAAAPHVSEPVTVLADANVTSPGAIAATADW